MSLKDSIKLIVLVEGDEALLNYISLIPVKKSKCTKVNSKDTMKFVKWMTSPAKGQMIIRDFGKEKIWFTVILPQFSGMAKKQKN